MIFYLTLLVAIQMSLASWFEMEQGVSSSV